MSATYLKKAVEIGEKNKGVAISNQGGKTFETSNAMELLRRFLILGTTSGSYYVSEQKLTDDATAVIKRALDAFGVQAVQEIVDASFKAPKLDPIFYAFAMASVHSDKTVRMAVYGDAFGKALRTQSHLFSFMQYRRALGKSSAGLRRAISRWYNDKAPKELAYQMIKYRERAGFSTADVLRMARPTPNDAAHNMLYKWAVDGYDESFIADDSLNQIVAYEVAKTADLETTIRLIIDHDLPREAINSNYLNDPQVWDALLVRMPLTATVRNLGNMSKSGLLVKGSEAAQTIWDRLHDSETIRKSKIHPMALFIAMNQYNTGMGLKGSGRWNPVTSVVDALDDAYRTSFGNVEPSGKKILVAVDTSGSMAGGVCAGTNITVAEGAGALAQIFAVTEPHADVISVSMHTRPLAISARQRAVDVASLIRQLMGGGTRLNLPFELAKRDNYDAVIVLTDSENGEDQAPTEYNAFMNGDPSRRAVLMQMVYNQWAIVDPKNQRSLLTVGLDSSAPKLATDFIAGNF